MAEVDRASIVARVEETGGTYALSRAAIPPGRGRAPRRNEFHEGFYILEGELKFTVGDREVTLGAGGFIAVGAGAEHAIENPGAGDAEFLSLSAPASGPAGFAPAVDDPRPAPEVVARRPGEGTAIAVVGDLYTFLAVGEETGGHYALWDAIVPPGGGPPPHIQTREYEGFYVLEGELAFRAEGRRVVAGPGDFVNVPPGMVHSFRNESDRPARQLIWVAPAGLEKLFEETGRVVDDRSAPIPPPTPDGIERLLAVAPRFGVEVRLPGGAAAD